MTISPTLRDQLRTLIATPSVSCTDATMDQGNEAVIHHLAAWAEDLGFRCEIMPVAPGKANLIATLGAGLALLNFAIDEIANPQLRSHKGLRRWKQLAVPVAAPQERTA